MNKKNLFNLKSFDEGTNFILKGMMDYLMQYKNHRPTGGKEIICEFYESWDVTDAISRFQKKFSSTEYCSICHCFEFEINNLIFKIEILNSETVRCYFTANSSDVKIVKHSKKVLKKINECFDWWEKESGAHKITEARDE